MTSCLLLVMALVAVWALPSPAFAQGADPYSRLRPLFGFASPQSPDAGSKKQRRRAALPAAKASMPAVPAKAADAESVLVVGDFFGQALGEGLAEAFSGEASVRVETATRSRASLLRDDPDAFLPLPEQAQPAAIVIMLGANDRHSLQTASGRLPVRAPAWNAAFEAKAAALVQAAATRKIPLLWVGLPPVASPKASTDFLAFNELTRSVTEAGGGIFLDPWDGFVNEAGAFAAFGPDIDGQGRRLRAKDGMGFTQAGRRKLAFFVQRPLAKVLSLPPAAGASSRPTANALPGAAAGPGRTEPMPLAGYALGAGEDGALLGTAADHPPAGTPDRLLYDPPAVRGRADDFSATSGASAATR